MAVKNIDLIAAACVENNITEIVKTFPQWKAAGYHIKAGSKALFKAQIWKPCKQKVKDENGTRPKRRKCDSLTLISSGSRRLKKCTNQNRKEVKINE